jgi:antirestriction protein ArdC
LASWLKVLKDDNKAIFKASALAQKATDYIMALDAIALQKVA